MILTVRDRSGSAHFSDRIRARKCGIFKACLDMAHRYSVQIHGGNKFFIHFDDDLLPEEFINIMGASCHLGLYRKRIVL